MMNNSAECYFRSARELRLPVETLEEEIDGFRLKLGKHIYFFRGGLTPFNNGSANNVSDNKYCVNKLLAKNGFPVPKAIGVTETEFTENKWDLGDLRFPLVIKPTWGTSCGQDVICNISDLKTLQKYLKKKFETHGCLSIEEFHPNLTSYRVLIFRNRVIAVVKRIPAHVIGDGKHTLLELIELENKLREKSKTTLTRGHLELDEESEIILNDLGMTPLDIPRDGQDILLRYKCNSTQGGDVISLGKQICKENAKLVCRAAKTLGLNLVGFDVLCEDIMIPIEHSRGVIIEANFHADVTLHEMPMEGKAYQVTKKMMRSLIYKHPFLYAMHRFKTRHENTA